MERGERKWPMSMGTGTSRNKSELMELGAW